MGDNRPEAAKGTDHGGSSLSTYTKVQSVSYIHDIDMKSNVFYFSCLLEDYFFVFNFIDFLF